MHEGSAAFRELFYIRKNCKRMKKMVLISSIVASSIGMMHAQTVQSASPASSAQVQGRPEARAKQKVAEINSLCGLKGDQVGKVNNAFVEFFQKRDALNVKKPTL